jgi:hypothetical protein
MAGAELSLDVRNLPAEARDSCRALFAHLSDLLKRPTVAVKLGLFATQRLPALHDHVHVLRIQFHAAADAFG